MSSADDDILQALKRVAVTLKDGGVPFALGGGCAVYARGGPASEHDVDFVLREQDGPRAVDVLARAGLRPEDAPEDWLVKVYDGDTLVDLIYRTGGQPVDDAMLARATTMEVSSIAMPVLDATDLVIGKLGAMSAHHCDFAPVLAWARSLREQVDWERVRAATAASPYARAFLFLLELLEIVGPAGIRDIDDPEETPWKTRTTSAVTSSSGSPRTLAPPSSASA